MKIKYLLAMIRSLFTSVAIVLISFSTVRACSCLFLPFCEYYEFLQEEALDYSLVIATRGEYTATGMKFNILQTLEGERLDEQADINMSVGTSCEISRENFESGERYLMLVRIHSGSNERFYSLNPCATHALRISGSTLQGMVADGISEISLTDFQSRPDCPALTDFAQTLNAYAVATASGTVDIYFRDVLTSPVSTKVEYSLYSAGGQEIYHGMQTISSDPISIETEGWPAGIYMIRLTALAEQQTLKIMKM